MSVAQLSFKPSAPLLITAFLCGSFLNGLGAEPAYQGKPASYWFELQRGTREQIQQSTTAFETMGSNAVPFLVQVLQRKPSAISTALDHSVYGNGPAQRLPRSVKEMLPSAIRIQEHREDAAYLLSRIAPDAAAAAPVLLAILTDPSEGWRMELSVRSSLFGMCDKLADYIPDFIKFLSSPDSRTRCLGADFLAGLGPKARSAVPALRELSASEDPWVSLSVAYALWRIDAQTNLALMVYTSSLQSTDSSLRRRALESLQSMGSAAEAAVPALIKLAQSRDWDVSLPVAHALYDLARQTNLAMNVYAGCLDSTNSALRQQALVYLRQMGTAAKPVGPQVAALLQDHDEQIRHESERTLREIDSALLQSTLDAINGRIHAAIAELIHMLRSGELKDRRRALGIIGAFGADAKPAVPDLINLISASQMPGYSVIEVFQVHVLAVEAVGEIGPEARAAVPALVARLGDVRDSGRHAYCRALGGIGAGAKEAVPALEATLGDADRLVRLSAAVALTRIEPEHCAAAVSVLKSLQNDPELARVWVVNDDGVAGPTSRLDWQNPQIRWVRLVAWVPLWRLGVEKAAPVEAILKEVNNSGSPDNAYIDLVGDIGPEARAALPGLEKFLGSWQPLIL